MLTRRRSGRGNVFLESAVPLAKSLHREIVRLGKRLDDAATLEEAFRHDKTGRKTSMSEAHRSELALIIKEIQTLISRIDRDIPLIHLAITNSGEKMNSTLSPGISPSRMMQASWLLNYADLQFVHDPSHPVQIGPSFTLSLYMLFRGHSPTTASANNHAALPSTDSSGGETSKEEPYGLGEGERKPIWQEVIHKARVKLCRTPLGWRFEGARGYYPQESPNLGVAKAYSATSAIQVLTQPDQYSYYLEVFEDLDDGRVHEDGPKHHPFGEIASAGIRESIPVHQIAKIFYTDTGKLLNIKNTSDGDNSPVLLLKRDVDAKTPTRLRQEWFDDSDSETQGTNGDPADDQFDVDRQLLQESELAEISVQRSGDSRTNLPAHLDPEWLAFEVFMEDNNDSGESESEDDETNDDDTNNSSDGEVADASHKSTPQSRPSLARDRSSIDSNLVARLKSVSLGSNSPGQAMSQMPPGCELQTEGVPESSVARSPFGAVLTSLSLLEMLIRLTSLQEFQQTPHLSIPDHILTFFLDETSTTGLQGEAHWAMRNEAKRRVGFDPYTNTPPR